MILFELDENKRILFVRPTSPLQAENFGELADIAKTIAGHFVAAEMRAFRGADAESAEHWISQQLQMPREYS